jgi:hypothetical protein
MTGTYVSPNNCAAFGYVISRINAGTSFTLVSPENFNCFTTAGIDCDIPNVPFGAHTIQVTPNSPTGNASINVNGQVQAGANGTYTFNVTNDALTPDIVIAITTF